MEHESMHEDMMEGSMEESMDASFPGYQVSDQQGKINPTLKVQDVGTKCHYDSLVHEPGNLGY